jgi:hypothetical protein
VDFSGAEADFRFSAVFLDGRGRTVFAQTYLPASHL